MTFSFCITFCSKDYHLLCSLLKELELQTQAPDEIIIVSSGIKKESVNKVECVTMCGKDIPVTHINREKQFFAGKARNLCAKHSSCDVLIYMDGDDTPHPQKIGMTKTLFNQEHKIDMVVHSFTGERNGFIKYKKLDDSYLCRVSSLFERPDGKKSLRLNDAFNRPKNRIAHGPIAIKRRLLNKEAGGLMWNPQRRSGEDSQFCRKAFMLGYNIMHINLPLIYYSKTRYIFNHSNKLHNGDHK